MIVVSEGTLSRHQFSGTNKSETIICEENSQHFQISLQIHTMWCTSCKIGKTSLSMDTMFSSLRSSPHQLVKSPLQGIPLILMICYFAKYLLHTYYVGSIIVLPTACEIICQILASTITINAIVQTDPTLLDWLVVMLIRIDAY